MILVIWEFRAKAGKKAEFEREYRDGGAWTRLFRRSPDYRGTTLLRDADSKTRFITIDAWRNRASYLRFQKKYAAEYAAIDRDCEKLTAEEIRLGFFQAP